MSSNEDFVNLIKGSISMPKKLPSRPAPLYESVSGSLRAFSRPTHNEMEGKCTAQHCKNPNRPRITLVELLQGSRETPLPLPPAQPLIDNRKSSCMDRRITEGLPSGADMIELANEPSEENGCKKPTSEKPVHAPLSPLSSGTRSIRFADESFTPSVSISTKQHHSILKQKENPHEEEERKKIMVLHSEENEAVMTPDAKAARFKYVKSPIPRRSGKKYDTSNKDPTKTYLIDRLRHLNEMIEMIKGKNERVKSKREKLDELINKNLGELDQRNVVWSVDKELLKLKSMVCRNEIYLATVNYYTFTNRTFGWKIPIATPHLHLPYVDFDLSPYPLLCRIELLKKGLKKIDLSNIASILACDIPIKRISIELYKRWELQAEEYIKTAVKAISEALEGELRLQNKLRTNSLGAILFELIARVRQFVAYVETISKIANDYIVGGILIEDGMAQYTVTIGSGKEKIIAGYTVKAQLTDLKKISEITLLYLQVVPGDLDAKIYRTIDGIKGELENSLRESIGSIKEVKIEIHYKLAEFVQRFISHYEEQLFASQN